MNRETPRYKVEPMRRNDQFFMVTDTHRVVAIEIRLSQPAAEALCNKMNGGGRG